jgi:hypothetical protein
MRLVDLIIALQFTIICLGRLTVARFSFSHRAAIIDTRSLVLMQNVTKDTNYKVRLIVVLLVFI